MPFIDATKIPTRTVGLSVDSLAPTADKPSANDIGAFRTVCDYSHMAYDDPIVLPGQAGKSHLHVFFGNTGTDANSTATSIATTGNSTCRGGTINRTGYWAPAMIDTKDGTPIRPNHLMTYYKTGYAGVVPSEVRAIPQGLRMVAGDSKGTAPLNGASLRFTCMNLATGTGPVSTSIPNCQAVTEELWVMIQFPQCWDGVNLDSPDHKSHMAYPPDGGKGCSDPKFPVALPEITMQIVYDVKEANSTKRWRLASDNYSSTLPGGYSLHADWFNGWKADIMDTWIKNCDQKSVDCAAHMLGDGRMMTGIMN